MTSSEHAVLVKQESAGSILLGVDRAHARQFYTDISVRVVEEQTGEAPYFEKMTVWLSLIGSIVALLVSFWFAILAFRWWSVIVIPVALMLWLLYASRSTAGTSRLLGSTVVVAGVVALHFLRPDAQRFTPFLLSLALALWLYRFVYISATHFLRSFIIRNHRAFTYVHEFITIRSA